MSGVPDGQITDAHSVADDASAAWDEVEANESGVAPSPPQPQYEQAQEPAGDPRNQQLAPAFDPSQADAGAPFYQPPSSWSPQAKAQFAHLPPEIQEAVAIREQQMADGQEMYQGLRGWVDFARERGTDLPSMIQDGAHRLEVYEAADQHLANDFYGAVGQLAQMYGVDVNQLVERYVAEQNGQYYQAPPPDPMIPYMQGLERQIEELRSLHENQQNEAINGQIQAFAQDHMYFSDVEPIMAEVIKYVRANDGIELSLEEAYEAACRMHPGVFQARLQAGDYLSEPAQRAQGQPRQSNGQFASSNPPQKGRSLTPGSPIPGASAAPRLPSKISAHDEIAAYYDELTGM